jgi:outer membrane protein assembly factor BamD (BamD/ComL family)
MSIAGIASSNFLSSYATQNSQSSFQQIRSAFQQLGTDLQSGNLSQAQQDFSSLAQDFQGAGANASTAATTAAAANSSTTSATAASTVSQAFSQLGQDLQTGNLAAAQQDFTSLQTDLSQTSAPAAGGHHHHHFHTEQSQSSSSSPSTNPIVQVFNQLTQFLQAGNLSGAQTAYSALQADLQQIGGLVEQGTSAGAAIAGATAAGSLSVNA